MLSEQACTFEDHDVAIVLCRGEPWFRASDITTALDYKKSALAIRQHVNNDYVRSFSKLQEEAGESNAVICSVGIERGGRSPLYINESGVYELVWHSKKAEALRFRRWIVEEVLPEIRKTGRFVRYEQVSLMCETDLHYKVVDFIRMFFAEAILIPGLGELQDSDAKRRDAWRKGYKSGQPDILILNRARKSSGLAIELKTPLGCGNTSANQDAFLSTLQSNNYERLVSNSYDEIVVKIIEYREAVRRCIPKRSKPSSVE